ncbi:MAG: hypothetical protein ACOX3R_02780 [Desulfitobacteriia bacterium]|jgi:hypothetical protein
MLSKLIKYEFKATARFFLPLFLALLVFAVISRIIVPLGPEEFDIPAVISMVLYISIMVGMFVMTFIMMIQRFYKNLLTEEGYLMFTLPVKPWQHIVSKLLVSMFWVAASGLAALTSILIITLREGSFTSFLREFSIFYHQVLEYLGASVYLVSFEIILAILVTLASGILIIYASIAIGHLFNHHKILASLGAFIALNTLSQILFLLLSQIPGMSHFANFHITPENLLTTMPIFHLAIAFGTFFALLWSAAYFATANYILSKRLNLE